MSESDKTTYLDGTYRINPEGKLERVRDRQCYKPGEPKKLPLPEAFIKSLLAVAAVFGMSACKSTPTPRPIEFPTSELIPGGMGGEIGSEPEVPVTPTKGPEASPTADQIKAFLTMAVSRCDKNGDGPAYMETLELLADSEKATALVARIIPEGATPKTTLFTSSDRDLFAWFLVDEGIKVGSVEGGVSWIREDGVYAGEVFTVTNAQGQEIEIFKGDKGNLFVKGTAGPDITGRIDDYVEVEQAKDGGFLVTSRVVSARMIYATDGRAILIETIRFDTEGQVLRKETDIKEKGYGEFAFVRDGITLAIWNPYKYDNLSGKYGAWPMPPDSPDVLWENKMDPTPKPESVINREFGPYAPEWKMTEEVVVDGINLNITLGLTKSIISRSLEPVKALEPSRPDSFERLGRFHLQMCWLNYKKYNPGNEELSFEQYEELVKQGGGEITIAAVDLAKCKNVSESIRAREILEISPTKVSCVLHDGSLPVALNANVGVYLARNQEGGLTIVDRAPSSRQLEGVDEWWPFGDPMPGKGLETTRCFITADCIIAVGDNNLLRKGSYLGSGKEYSVRPVGNDFLYPLDKLICESKERTLFYVVQESTGLSK